MQLGSRKFILELVLPFSRPKPCNEIQSISGHMLVKECSFCVAHTRAKGVQRHGGRDRGVMSQGIVLPKCSVQVFERDTHPRTTSDPRTQLRKQFWKKNMEKGMSNKWNVKKLKRLRYNRLFLQR